MSATGSITRPLTGALASSLASPGLIVQPDALLGNRLLCWLRADTYETSPSFSWTDKTGNGHSPAPFGSNTAPTFDADALGGAGGLVFDEPGTDGLRVTSFTQLASEDIHLFVYGSIDDESPTGVRYMTALSNSSGGNLSYVGHVAASDYQFGASFSGGDTTNRLQPSGPALDNNPHLFCLGYSPAGVYRSVDGSQPNDAVFFDGNRDEAPTTPAGLDRLTVACRTLSDGHVNATIGEILVVNGGLTVGESRDLTNYLNDRYGSSIAVPWTYSLQGYCVCTGQSNGEGLFTERANAPNALNFGFDLEDQAHGASSLAVDWYDGSTNRNNLITEISQYPAGARVVALWIQGEADAAVEADANAYETNLGSFIDDVELDTGRSDIYWIMTGPHPDGSPTYRATVRTATQTVCAARSNCTFVDISSYTLDDSVHWYASGAPAFWTTVRQLVQDYYGLASV